MPGPRRPAGDLRRVRASIRRFGLPVVFGAVSGIKIAHLGSSPSSLGFDARLYQIAARSFLEDADPWSATLDGFAFAGPPASLLPYLPLAYLDANLLAAAHIVVDLLAIAWALRRLSLPLWWLGFPPIVEGVWMANLNPIVLAALVSGSSLLRGVAPVLKTYAALPLLGALDWRSLLAFVAVSVASLPLLPWPQFADSFARITSTLAAQSWAGSPTILVEPLWVLVAVALVLLGRERARWYVVPALWPSSQLHYAVLALPAIHPITAILAAIPYPGMFGVGVVLLAGWEAWAHRHAPDGGVAGRIARRGRRLAAAVRLRADAPRDGVDR